MAQSEREVERSAAFFSLSLSMKVASLDVVASLELLGLINSCTSIPGRAFLVIGDSVGLYQMRCTTIPSFQLQCM